jgi:hypothetical protein
VGAVPGIDPVLQSVAEGEQLAVSRAEVADDGGEASPERVGLDSGIGRRLPGDEIVEDRGDLQSVGIDTLHEGLLIEKSGM